MKRHFTCKTYALSLVVGIVAVLSLWAALAALAPAFRPSPHRATHQPISASGAPPRLAANYGKLPLSFEPNRGQSAGPVKFLSRGRGYTLFLTGDEAVLTLPRAGQMANGKGQMAKVAPTFRARPEPGEGSASAGLDFGLVDARVAPTFRARSEPGEGSAGTGVAPRSIGAALPGRLPLPGAIKPDGAEMPRNGSAGPALPSDLAFGSLFSNPQLQITSDLARIPEPEAQPSDVVRLRLVGANAKARVTGAEKLPGKSNYFIGDDPKKWRTNVPTYAKVK